MGLSLSFSAAQRFILSPFSYFAHYFLRLRPVDASSALIFGAAFDNGLNTLLETKDLVAARAAFLQSWDKGDINGTIHELATCDCIKYSKADYDDSFLEDIDRKGIEAGAHPAWVALRRKGLLMLHAYSEQVLPRVKRVIAVQRRIALDNEIGDQFIGVVDAVLEWEDGNIYIVDNKTSSVRYKAESANESAQLASYYEAIGAEYGASGVLYITISKSVRKKKKPAVQIEFIFGQASETLIEKTFQDYDSVLSGIKQGQFPCTADQENGCCSTPWGCTYARFCASGGKDMTGLTYVDKK